MLIGGYSQIQCELLLLKTAFNAVPQMDYFHLISGADYPCKNNNDFDHFFEVHNGESFMHFDSDDEIQMWRNTKYKGRIQTWNLVDIFPRMPRKIKRYVSGLLNLIVRRKWIPNVVAGWQWFSWHRSVVAYVFAQLKSNHKYINRFKYTSCCDEVFFHTLLQNKTTELKINKYNALRFIEWHPNRPYSSLPLVLEDTEYNDIINSGAMFCRKVEPIKSKELLNKLNQHIQ